MSKQYSTASADVINRIERLQQKFHSNLEGVTIQSLFVFSEEPGCALKHQGYPAGAIAKIVSTKDRAAGLADAMIVVDRYTYSGLTEKRKDALIDHELYHFDLARDKDGFPKADGLGRLKLKMRMHDHQLGWFDAIANRHGEHSMEVVQAKELIAASGQIYFNFGDEPDAEQEAA